MRSSDLIRRVRAEQRRVYRLGFEAGVYELLDVLSREAVVICELRSATVVHIDRRLWQRLMTIADDAEPDAEDDAAE